MPPSIGSSGPAGHGLGRGIQNPGSSITLTVEFAADQKGAAGGDRDHSGVSKGGKIGSGPRIRFRRGVRRVAGWYLDGLDPRRVIGGLPARHDHRAFADDRQGRVSSHGAQRARDRPSLTGRIEDGHFIAMDQQHSAVRESGRRMAFESILIIEDERHGNRSPILRTQRFADLGAGQPVPVVRQPAGPSTDQQQTVVVESHHRRIGSRNDQGAAHGFPATSRVANLHRGGRAEIGGEATHEDPASVEHRGGRFRDGDARRLLLTPRGGMDPHVLRDRRGQDAAADHR